MHKVVFHFPVNFPENREIREVPRKSGKTYESMNRTRLARGLGLIVSVLFVHHSCSTRKRLRDRKI